MVREDSLSVLIVEDERIVARDIQLSLRDLGYDAFAIASSAEEAIALASDRCPDLVLMDIRINGQRDGIETASILRSKYGVPVVYMTAHADAATIDRAKKTEPHGYLVKPVKADELRSVIEISVYRHDMERRLRERERWFSATLRSIADAVIAVDLAGDVTFMNPAAEALTGVSGSVAMGRPARDVLRIVDPPNGDTPLMQALRDGRSVELMERSVVNATNGVVRTTTDNMAPVVDDQATLGAVMVFRDVTDQKQLQRQLEITDRLASLATMAAGVVHEVNNPLSVVVANAGFLTESLGMVRSERETVRGSSHDVDQRLVDITDALVDLQAAAGRIGAIVSDLRTFSAPAGHIGGAVDVIRCVEWAIGATSHELHDRAQVSTELGTVPPVSVDETKLGQVIVNLLLNAADAIAPGNAAGNEVRIATRTDKSGRATIEVRDTGTGIRQDVLDRIFEPFFTTKSHGARTGLGLSVCQGIVSAGGGQIQVETDLGRGTTVRVMLPAAVARTFDIRAATPASATYPRGRILVVDDQPMVLSAIKRTLREHDLVCLTSAQEALTLIERGEPFDLILSDLMMPSMTGIEFYERLLSVKPELARRIVFLTGGATTPEAIDFFQSVPNIRIDKPFGASKLQATVRQLLAARPSERAH